jgi:hypothetical protein
MSEAVNWMTVSGSEAQEFKDLMASFMVYLVPFVCNNTSILSVTNMVVSTPRA